MRRNVLLLGAILSVFFISCKKDDSVTPPTTPGQTSAADKLKDSVLLYARDIYLWYNNIPQSFNARGYDDANEIMEAIRPYSTEPGFSKPVDRWSFAVTKAEWDGVSSGISGDFGMGVFFLTNSDLRVSYVERESPAGKAGIRRGWRIKAINGSTNIAPSNANAIISAVYQSNSSSFTFTKPTGGDVNITLNAAGYKEHPIFLDSVYTSGGRKSGYLVFNSFLGDTTEIYNEFSRVFNRFSAAGVQDVIVDLRYNGGGYVSVQNVLANWLVPNAGNGGVMEVQQYNEKYNTFNETIKYQKKGSLNLSRLFVIVSQQTASASELLINSLTPYLDVQLVGPSATHGKPVGFFPIPVGDWYIFPVSFRTVNKNGDGNYFDGIALDHQVGDGLDKDWGDVNESCLGTVLNFINSGSFARTEVLTQANIKNLSAEVQTGNSLLGAPKFKGAIGVRH
jgi:carboxyl-terminal processing protease